MLYNILSIIGLCFVAILAVGLCYLVGCAIRRKWTLTKKTVWYVAPVFVAVYLLYALGYAYKNGGINIFVLFRLVPITFEAFVLKIDIDYVAALATDNIVYCIAMAIADILAGATLIFSALIVWGAKVINSWNVRTKIKAGKDFVLGDSPHSLRYAKENDAIVITFAGSAKFKQLINDGYCVASCSLSSTNCRLIKKLGVKHNVMRQFIAFVDNRFYYVQLIEWFVKSFGTSEGNYFTLHIEASLDELDVINRKFIDKKKFNNICVMSFNKHELLARKFVMDYPMSLDIPEDFYTDLRTIKSDKNINVVLLGFGKVNYELMKVLVMQNQFVGLNREGTKFVNHQVNYYIYDNAEDKVYSDMLMLLQNSLRRQAKTDLPYYEDICNIKCCKKCNVYSDDFAKELENIVGTKDSFTCVIVSIGNDYENMSYAEYIDGAYGNDKIRIFARVKETATLHNNELNNITTFGYDGELLTHNAIINDELDSLARAVNDKYQNVQKAVESYNKLSTMEIYSNMYHAASIYFKMGLLGLRIVKKENCSVESVLVSKEELFRIYNGCTACEGYNRYFDLTTWNMLGFSEHSRWVAQYVLKGFRPMPLGEIKIEKVDGTFKITTKDMQSRKHCCLTDFYGLDIYHKHLLKLYNDNGVAKTINHIETYQYDYIGISNCYDDMAELGYALVKSR